MLWDILFILELQFAETQVYKPSCIFLITHLKRKDFIHPNVLDLPIDEEHPARSAHDCRRTYASLEYLNGTDIFTLSKKPRSIDFTMFLGFRQEHETGLELSKHFP